MNKPSQADAFPVAEQLRSRATYSLPATLVRDITAIAKRMGVTQSALLAELLVEPITAMRDVLDQLPTVGATPDDVKRAKGKSLALIRDVVSQAQTLIEEEATSDGHR